MLWRRLLANTKKWLWVYETPRLRGLFALMWVHAGQGKAQNTRGGPIQRITGGLPCQGTVRSPMCWRARYTATSGSLNGPVSGAPLYGWTANSLQDEALATARDLGMKPTDNETLKQVQGEICCCGRRFRGRRIGASQSTQPRFVHSSARGLGQEFSKCHLFNPCWTRLTG